MNQADKITALLSDEKISAAAIEFADKIANNKTLMEKLLKIIKADINLESKRKILSQAIITASKNPPAASKIIVEQVVEKSKFDLAKEAMENAALKAVKANAVMKGALKKLRDARQTQASNEDNHTTIALQNIYYDADSIAKSMQKEYDQARDALTELQKQQGNQLAGGRNRRTKKTKYSSKQIRSKRVNKKQKIKQKIKKNKNII